MTQRPAQSKSDGTAIDSARRLGQWRRRLRRWVGLLLVGLGLLLCSGEAVAARPLVSIRSHQFGKDGSLTLEVEVLAAIPGLPLALRPLIDGKSIRSVSQKQSRKLGVGESFTLTLPVRQRDFVVSVVAVQPDGTESVPAVLAIRESQVDSRPRLYGLALGIGRYRDPEISQLRFPAKDAEDLVTVLRAQSNRVYRSVELRLLTEEEASLDGLRGGLRWLAETTHDEDTTILFLAGHGTNDPDGTYYFLPSGAHADRSTLMSGYELQRALHEVRGQVILLLDTCHSGNVLGRRSLTRLVNELVTENRIAVLTASTGEQASQESAEWQNGAFTKAVVEGLRGAADYQEDGIILLSELETWVGLRVRQLTQGSQTVAMAKPNAAPDYVVAAVPKRGRQNNPQTVRRRIIWGSVAAVLVAATVAVTVYAVARPDNSIKDLLFAPASPTTTAVTSALR